MYLYHLQLLYNRIILYTFLNEFRSLHCDRIPFSIYPYDYVVGFWWWLSVKPAVAIKSE
jgi:hypothetical protein